jgi:hypothetical protein
LIFRTICDYSFCRVIEHTAEGAYEQWRSTQIFSGAQRRDPDSKQVALNRNIGGAQERKYSFLDVDDTIIEAPGLGSASGQLATDRRGRPADLAGDDPNPGPSHVQVRDPEPLLQTQVSP